MVYACLKVTVDLLFYTGVILDHFYLIGIEEEYIIKIQNFSVDSGIIYLIRRRSMLKN